MIHEKTRTWAFLISDSKSSASVLETRLPQRFLDKTLGLCRPLCSCFYDVLANKSFLIMEDWYWIGCTSSSLFYIINFLYTFPLCINLVILLPILCNCPQLFLINYFISIFSKKNYSIFLIIFSRVFLGVKINWMICSLYSGSSIVPFSYICQISIVFFCSFWK